MPFLCTLEQRTLCCPRHPGDTPTLTPAETRTLTTCSSRSVSGLVSYALPLLLQLGGLQPSYREKSPNFEHKIEFVKVTDALMNTAFAQRFNFISLKNNIATSSGIQFNFCISPRDEYPVLNGSFKIVAPGTTLFVSNACAGLSHHGDGEKDISIELWLSITRIMINDAFRVETPSPTPPPTP